MTPIAGSKRRPYELRRRAPASRYGIAVVLALAGAVATRVLAEIADAPSYAVIVAAVAVSVWLGGFVPGVVSLIVGWPLTAILLAGSPAAEGDNAYLAVTALLASTAVVWVSLVMRRGYERAASAATELEESTRHMRTLQELATALSAAVSPSDVAHELVERTPALLRARGGALGVIDGDEVVIVDPAGVQRQTHPPGRRLPLSAKAPIARAAAEGTLQRVGSRSEFEERYPDGAALTPYASAAIAVPLRGGGQVVGAISFLYDDPSAVHDDADAIALLAADLGGQALERARLYERERSNRRALDRILRVAPRLYLGDADEVGIAICREARRTLDADLTEIWRLDDERLWLELTCRDPEDVELSGHDRLEIAQLPGLLDAVETLEISFVPDAGEVVDGALSAYVERLGIRSWLWSPIVVGGHPDRVLFFSWKTPLPDPDPSTILLARRFSDQAGLALEQLERRQAEEEAARSARETRRLLDVTAALAAATTPAEVTQAVLDEGLRSLGATAGMIVAPTEEGDALRLLSAEGYPQEALADWREFPLDADVPLAEAVRDGRLIAIETREELESRYAEAEGGSQATGAWLGVPLSAGGSVIGAVGLAFPGSRTFSDADLDFVQALARQSGQALERAFLLASESAARTLAEDMVVLTSALSQAVSPLDVVHAAGAQLNGALGEGFTAIYLLRGRRALELVGTAGDAAAMPARLAVESATPAAEAARTLTPVWLDSDAGWDRYPDAAPSRAAGIGSSGAVPLVVDGTLLGVLVVALQERREIPPSERRFVESVARQAAQPLERSWLMERAQAARVAAEDASRRTRRLQFVTQALAAASTQTEVASIVVGEAQAAVTADGAALLLFDGRREAPEVLAASGLENGSLVEELTGVLAETALAGLPLVVDADAAAAEQAASVRSALRASGFHSAVGLPLAVGSRVLGCLLVCFATRDRVSAEDEELLQTLARIGAQALERSRLFDEEQRQRLRSDQLQQLTATLAGSLTQADVAAVVVDSVVQATGADAAVVSVVLEDRQVLRPIAWHGYADELVAARGDVSLELDSPGTRAVRRGQTAFFRTVDETAAEFPDSLETLRATGYESFLFIPLVVAQRATGLLVTSWQEPVTLAAEDRLFVETLAGQAAQVLERAKHFESERTIAETLQRSVLPVSLPHVEGVQLAARYLPGTEEVDVGGDWFDAIQLPNGRLGLTVGDVVGKGIQSAATMAQLRNALRAFALDQMRPSSTLARLNRLMGDMSESGFATVVYAVLDPETGVCRFSAAGHPPPLVLRPDGTAAFLEDGRGLPLGTLPDATYRHGTVKLPVGSTLLLYTDGLVERRGEPIDRGLEKLRRVVEEGPGGAEQLVEHALDRLVGGGQRGDDVAMLAVRLLAVAPRALDMSLPRTRRSLDVVRDAMRVWLVTAPVSQREAHDIVLASWEACANAVEHPHPPSESSFRFRAELVDGAVRVAVHDPGSWLPESDRPQRGLGLPLIRGLMSDLQIETDGEGTVVTLEKLVAARDVPVV